MKQLLSVSFLLFTTQVFSQNEPTVIYFEYGSYNINSSELQKLKELEELIQNEEIANLEIYGYSDTTSSESYNLNLSKLRCESVNSALNNVGNIIVKGEVIPAVDYNASTARRCEIFFEYASDFEIEPPMVILPPKEENKFNPIIEDFIDSEDETISIDIEILFEGGTAIALPESEVEARQLLFTLRDYPELRAKIHGHVCCNDDMQLSIERAVAIFNYLVVNGIDRKRLEYTGHSNKQPKVFPDLTEEDHIQNRRVRIEFIKN